MSGRTGRWGIALVGIMMLVSVGLLAAEPFLLATAAVPLVYVLYGALARVPDSASVRAERAIETVEAAPGETVTVALTLTNDGTSTLTDVRIVDGVPGELTVVDGSPRACVSVRPGTSRTVRYSVVATRGTVAFDDPVVRVRSLAGTAVATATVEATGETSMTCTNVVSQVHLADTTVSRAGVLPTDSGGSGLEFHATRDYQHGDPVSRIDWRRFAKTNELTTVEYREERAVRTVLIVDARPQTRVTAKAGYPTGAELGSYAAERLFDALTRTGDIASVVAVGLDEDDVVGTLDPDALAWVDPDGDGDSDARVAQVFDGVQSAATKEGSETQTSPGPGTDAATAMDGGASSAPSPRTVVGRLPPTAQVVVFSPLLDEWPVMLVQRLAARNYPTTVVSPDVTGGDEPGQSVVSLERDLRCGTIELAETALIDWDLEQPIDVALRASLATLSRS